MEKKKVEEPAEPQPRFDPGVEAVAMTSRMMWGIARGVSATDKPTLAKLRDMNRKQRRSYLKKVGKRQRKGS